MREFTQRPRLRRVIWDSHSLVVVRHSQQTSYLRQSGWCLKMTTPSTLLGSGDMKIRHEICDVRKHTQRSQFDVFSCGLLVIFQKTKFLNKANVHSVLSFDLYVSH